MLRNTLVLFLLLIGFNAAAQTKEARIQKDFIDYQNLIKNGKYEASLNYVYPKFFTLISKDKMLKMMTTMLNNKMLKMEFGNTKIVELGESHKIGKSEYIVFSYITEIKMKVLLADGKGTAEQQQLLNKRMQETFAKQYGKNNVKFDKETGYFTLTPTKKAVAISEDGGTNWTYIAAEPQQKQLVETILPDAVVAELF